MKKLILFLLLILPFSQCNPPSKEDTFYILHEKKISKQDPDCIQVYYYVKKYCKQYEIPEKYAFGIAYAETRYMGPFHFKYSGKRVSEGGALGVMQLMFSTAKYINKEDKFTCEDLKNNIELNIKTSCILLRRLKNKYGSWLLTLGAYNTGQPVENEYSKKIIKGEYKWLN